MAEEALDSRPRPPCQGGRGAPRGLNRGTHPLRRLSRTLVNLPTFSCHAACDLVADRRQQAIS